MSINGFPNEYNNVISPSYIVAGDSVVLTSERVLTAGSGISLNDAGPGGALTVSTTGLAVNSESFLVLGNSANLSAERVLTAGTGVSFTDAGANSTLTINNTSSGFNTITVSNFSTTQSDIVSDSLNDTLGLTSGANMDISTNASTDTLTFKTWDSDNRTTGTFTLHASSATIQACDNAGGAITFNLPLASTCHGKIFVFHQAFTGQTTANAVTVSRSGSDNIIRRGGSTTSTTTGSPGSGPAVNWMAYQADGNNNVWREFIGFRFSNNLVSGESIDQIDFGLRNSDTADKTLANFNHMLRIAENTTGDLTYTMPSSIPDRKIFILVKNQPNASVHVAAGGSNTFNNVSGFTSFTMGASGSIGDTVWFEGDTSASPDTWRILARTDLHKWAYRAKTASFTAEYGSWNNISTAGGNVTATLPTAVNRAGEVIAFKHGTGGNTLFIATTSSQTIDGHTSLSFANVNDCLRVISDGANWRISDNQAVKQIKFISSTATTADIRCATLATSRSISIPDPGANANFVLSESTQTINGAITFSANTIFSSTGAVTVSVGTTAQRPANGAGKLRWNSDLAKLEVNNGTTWETITSV